MKKNNKERLLVGIIIFTFVLTLINSNSIMDLRDASAGVVIDMPNAPAPIPTAPQPQEPTKLQVSVDDDAFKGKEDAPVTIVEFSDFECPFCARFYTQTLPALEQRYINTGKVKFVYRDFPLSFHQNAQKAAEAAECAGDQGNFWGMHDKIFENQESLSVNNLRQWASDIGLDSAEFNNCLDSSKFAEEVNADFSQGQSYGVTGTPAFFINGIKLVGAQPLSAFKKIIDQELAG